MVGASNTEWTKLKKQIFRYGDTLNDLKKKFTRDVTGWAATRKVKEELDKNPDKVESNLKKYLSKFKKEVSKLEKQYNKDKKGIPKNVIAMQDAFMKKEFKVIQMINDVNTLKRYFNRELG